MFVFSKTVYSMSKKKISQKLKKWCNAKTSVMQTEKKIVTAGNVSLMKKKFFNFLKMTKDFFFAF